MVYYDKNSLEILLSKDIDPITNNKTYQIQTTEKLDKNNFIISNNSINYINIELK